MKKKGRPQEEFLQELSQVHPGFVLLTEYVRTREKVRCRCPQGHEWDQLPRNLIKNDCPECTKQRLSELKTLECENHDEFVALAKKTSPNIMVVSEYTGSKSKIRCRCNQGHEYEILPNRLLYKSHECPYCSNRVYLSKKKYKQRLQELNSNIEMIGEYKDSITSIQFRCKKDGYIWSAKPLTMLNNCVCKKCSGDVRGYSQEEFVAIVQEKCPNLEILSEYKSMNESVEYKCNVCGFVSKRPATGFIKGQQCPNCLGKVKDHDGFIAEMKEKHPNLIILNQYETAKTRIYYKCTICGITHDATAHNLSRGYGCPICSLSKGEKTIVNILNKQHIEYECQKSFDELTGVNGGLLSYDFYLPNYNLLIEYQGEQHEHPVDFKGKGKDYSLQQYEIQQNHDKLKREFAKSRKIDLLEIWYYQYEDIEEIIYKAIKR